MAYEYAGVTQDDGAYCDFDFYEGKRRWLRVSYVYPDERGADGATWYGIIMTAEDDDAAFDHEEGPITPEILTQLRAMIPDADLPDAWKIERDGRAA